MSEHPDLLLTEVVVGHQRFCVEAGAGAVWQIAAQSNSARKVPAAPQELRAALSKESCRQFLDAQVDEGLLETEIAALWQRYRPGDEAIPLSVPVRALQAEPVPSALTARVERGAHVGTVMWCDVQTLPPRTLDVTRTPTVQTEAGSVSVRIPAFGPPGRAPYVRTLLARFWHPGSESSVAHVPLAYEALSHTFAGREQVFTVLDLQRWAENTREFILDVTTMNQARPMPRDDDHARAWDVWRSVNADWLTDMTTVVGSPAVLPESWLPVVRVSHEAAWTIIDPLSPRGDRGPGAERYRRLGIVAYYESAVGDPNPLVHNALAVDRLLASEQAGSPLAEEDLASAGMWLIRQAKREPASDYARRVLADTCDDYLRLWPRPELADAARSLRSMTLADVPPAQPAIRARHAELDVDEIWLGVRSARLRGDEQFASALLATLPEESEKRARLAAYRPAEGLADRPLLAEVISQIDQP